MGILEQLGQAATATSTVARGVRADQLAQPTPCDQWDVQALMNHTIGSLEYFAARAQGKDVERPQPASPASFEETVEWLVKGASSAAASW